MSNSGGGETTRTKRPCGISSFLPLGMSCRGRAEAFARSLQFRLRSLGSQEATAVVEPATNNNAAPSTPPPVENAWTSPIQQDEHVISNPLTPRNLLTNNIQAANDTDSYFDIDLETDSPGSPAEECEYTRLIETASTTPRNLDSIELVRASPASSRASSGDSLSSSDGPYFDPEITSEAELKSSLSLSVDFYDCDDIKLVQPELQNGHYYPTLIDSDSCSESLPNSQSTTTSLSTFTANNSSASNNTLQDEAILELCLLSKEQYKNDYDDSDQQLEFPTAHGDVEDFERLDYPRMADSIIEASPEPETIKIEEELVLVNSNDHLKVQIANNATATAAAAADDDDFEARPQRVRRCSSLKTGKTPPGTPGRKKFVRFADVLGLDLADVKTFMDEIPTVPKSAYEDLIVTGDDDDDILDETDSVVRPMGGPVIEKILMPLFQQPGGMPGFLDMVREQNVCLENAMVTDPICLTISGTVRVRNLDFNKSVHLRYSLDAWHSFSDFQANYIDNSCDGFSDKFSFTVFGNSLQIGQRIEMAVRFSCKGDQYWDNNFGINYCFQCLPATSIQKSIMSIMLPLQADEQNMTAAEVGAQDSCSGTFY